MRQEDEEECKTVANNISKYSKNKVIYMGMVNNNLDNGTL